MGKLRRINLFLQGIFMILLAVIMLTSSADDGYIIVLGILCLALLIDGINQMVYYLRLARYMVGGQIVLCRALIELDLGLEAIFLSDVPKYYVMIYLVIVLLFSGLVDVLRAMEAKKLEGLMWKIKFTQGMVTIILAIVGLCFINTANLIVYFYCLGIISAAITKITEAFRKTEIVYIN